MLLVLSLFKPLTPHDHYRRIYVRWPQVCFLTYALMCTCLVPSPDHAVMVGKGWNRVLFGFAQTWVEHLFPTRTTCITHSSQAGHLRALTPREGQRKRTRNWTFSVSPRLWNKFPLDIYLAPTLGVFQWSLKIWLFRQVSGSG